MVICWKQSEGREGREERIIMLKPPCVELNQVVLRFKTNKSLSKDVIGKLECLVPVLLRFGTSLDDKLADYVFVPLSYVFGERKALPARAIELALQCLHVLISSGWRDRLSSDLGFQLLLLLSFVAGGDVVDTKTKHADEEVGAIACKCLGSLFHASVASSLSENGAIQVEHIPLLGHVVTVLLDAVTDGPSTEVRLSALDALDALITSIPDQAALKSFFPGIVSSLTKAVSLRSPQSRPYKVLERSIRCLEQVLVKVLGDTALLLGKDHDEHRLGNGEDESSSWIKATSSQVKLALGNVVSLRGHDKVQVQDALFSLSTSVLQKCQKSLSNCTTMMLETLVALCSEVDETVHTERLNKVIVTLDSIPELIDVLKESLYDWIVALPRVMGSNDVIKRKRTIQLISASFQLLSSTGTELGLLNDLMVSNLQSSVSAVSRSSIPQVVSSVSEGPLEVTRMLQFGNADVTSSSLEPVLFAGASGKDIMISLQALTGQLKALSKTPVLQRLVDALRTSTGDNQKANLWLILQLFDDMKLEEFEADKLLNLPPDEPDPFLDDAYAYSLQILEKSTYDDKVDWQMQALSLQIIALQAHRQNQDFRPELVDALYPILERMGSSHTALQHHAIATLRIVSTACNYPSASALIISNADYLVNSLSLKLNLFDISPQASQVMLMMVRLCGEKLIPYLDDPIGSIFMILASYHGYPRLVESLFEVLNAIVEEGSKSKNDLLTDSSELKPKHPPYKPPSILEATSRISALRTRQQQ
ncbi:MAG: hypothetical protein Q9190_007873, partial [Brigantiaea leucoxantha]